MLKDDTEEAKENMKSLRKTTRSFLRISRKTLGDKVSEVKLSPRLKSSAVCLTTKGDISLEMEKILSAMPMDQGIKAERVLELNPEHSVFETLNKIKNKDADSKKLEVYANLLYNQALLISGIQIDDPVEFRVSSSLYFSNSGALPSSVSPTGLDFSTIIRIGYLI